MLNKTGDILIVDDTPDNLRFLSDLLTKAGYMVRRVLSGELGLEAAQLEPPDLILLDIRMPGLDGYKVCDRLKSIQHTAQIPVIFLSAMNEELDKVMAFEAGGVDYITKPFQAVEVLARIETHLQLSRLRQTLERQNAQLQQEISQQPLLPSPSEDPPQPITLPTSFANELLCQEPVPQSTQTQINDLSIHHQNLMDKQAELQRQLEDAQVFSSRQLDLIQSIQQDLEEVLTELLAALALLQQSPHSNVEQEALRSIADSTLRLDDVIQQVKSVTL
ncbi:MAG: response regulator [Elainella sp. Prado103]|nr:response regulator [Elainella sp. Prado103]